MMRPHLLSPLALGLAVALGGACTTTATAAPSGGKPAGVPGAQRERVGDAALQAQLQKILDAARADPKSDYPGSMLRIATSDEVWSVASGLANVKTGEPMRPEDSFRAGSIMKPFVAVVILQLVEEGKLKLDDHLTALLPKRDWQGFKYADEMTLEMLLSHRTGIGEYTETNMRAMVNAKPDKIWTAQDLIDVAAGLPVKFRPGTAYAYNNAEYNMLGLIIDRMTGVSWRQNVRDRVIKPLGLKDTWLPEPGQKIVPRGSAHGYEMVDGKQMDTTDLDPSIAGAAGGHALVTTTADLTTFLRALLAGRFFKKPDTLAAMMNFRQTDTPGRLYGLGLEKYQLPGGATAYGHFGTTGGYGAMIMYVPDGKITMSGMVSTHSGLPVLAFAVPALQATQTYLVQRRASAAR